MRNWLKNKTVVLSGASGGIGRELTKILIKKYNANVLGIGRDESKMQSLITELGEYASRFSYRLFDVSKKENWETLAADLKENEIRPVLLLNNAGAFPAFRKAAEIPSETAERIMQINYFSVLYAVELLSPLLKGEGKHKPAIVNISSSAALCTVVGTSVYSASKAALKGYSEGLQMEEKGKKYIGIIYPGTASTDLFRDEENMKNSALDYIAMSPEKMAKKIARKILKKRKRAVIGWDAKLMNFAAKIAPVKGLGFIRWIMKTSRSKVFSAVFDYGKK